MENHPRKNAPKEIERKFLVKAFDSFSNFLLNSSGFQRTKIKQGYLLIADDKVIRVRTSKLYAGGDHHDLISRESFLTVKGKQEGLSKTEIELPFANPAVFRDDVECLFDMCVGHIIEKTRFKIPYRPDTNLEMTQEAYDLIMSHRLHWEIDIFHGVNEGLIIAEIELPSEDFHIDIPPWLGEEVSTVFDYSNSNLAQNPYAKWV